LPELEDSRKRRGGKEREVPITTLSFKGVRPTLFVSRERRIHSQKNRNERKEEIKHGGNMAETWKQEAGNTRNHSREKLGPTHWGQGPLTTPT